MKAIFKILGILTIACGLLHTFFELYIKYNSDLSPFFWIGTALAFGYYLLMKFTERPLIGSSKAIKVIVIILMHLLFATIILGSNTENLSQLGLVLFIYLISALLSELKVS